MNKKQAKRVTVDYAHVEVIKQLKCVIRVITDPRVEVMVRSELTPDYPSIARFGDTIEVVRRRRAAWVLKSLPEDCFGMVFANKRLTPEEGGEE